MNIGIIVAMEKELQLLLVELSKYNTLKKNNYTFYYGTLGKHNIIILKCNIGKVNAALGVNKLIETFNIDLIINTGVAGGCNNVVQGDIIVGTRIAYHDVWCGSGTLWGQADGCPEYFITSSKTSSLACISDDSVKSGLVCSGDMFVTSTDNIKKHFPEVLAVDMESAAIAHVCYLNNVDLVCLKIISDNIDNPDNVSQYENFWETAPDRLFKVVTKILSELNISE